MIVESVSCTSCEPAHVLPLVPVSESGHLIDWTSSAYACGVPWREGWRYGTVDDLTCRMCRHALEVER